MKRLILVTLVLAACGGSSGTTPLSYTNPKTGKLLLIKDKKATGKAMILDLVVGKDPLTGYATGFDLPLDATKVALVADLTPGTGLDPGQAPIAAKATLPADGPLANQLVVGLSQKASGAGAVTDDAQLAPNTVLLSFQLAPIAGGEAGIVFDGTAADFVLPSGGLRDKMGNSVVDPTDVGIGKLELK